MKRNKGCGCVLLGAIVIFSVLYYIWMYSRMDIDIVTKEVVDALELPVDKIRYIGGGRQYCKHVAFNCLGEITNKKNVSVPMFRSQYIARAKCMQREYGILNEFDFESSGLEIYEKNGVVIYKHGNTMFAIISY